MSAAAQRVVGLDFGTTNSAVALGQADGGLVLPTFGEDARSTYRSVVFFDPDETDARGRPLVTTGVDAIAAYLESAASGRLVQSMKAYLPSKHIRATNIMGITYTLEQLVSLVVQGVRESVERDHGPLGRRALAGRPVHFTDPADPTVDAYAEGRLRRAFELAGFDEVAFELEPVAAAYAYERRLDHDELVLIADFGGGTSDFCLLSVGPGRRQRGREVLGTAGVPVAGDVLDSKIVRALVAPALGRGSTYQAVLSTKQIVIPAWIYKHLERWHHLSFLKQPKTMRMLHELQRQAAEPERLEALIHMVEWDLGYALYASVEGAKVALSDADEAAFAFADGPVQIDAPVAREAFEAWIEDPLSRMARCVDALLAEAGVSVGDVDRVFMTGGTSYVPSVRRIFTDRFGEDRLADGEQLTSVASGLALAALDRR